MNTSWCLEVLEDAIEKYGTPEIINSNQGSQYTSGSWQYFMDCRGIKSSMDGKGRALDNVWIERFWRSLKHDHVYLHSMSNRLELWISIQYYMTYYNCRVHHTTKETPDIKYNVSRAEAA